MSKVKKKKEYPEILVIFKPNETICELKQFSKITSRLMRRAATAIRKERMRLIKIAVREAKSGKTKEDL